jgi:hypothetical protein
MKNIISTLILMFALVTSMAGANQVMASPTATSSGAMTSLNSASAPSTKASLAGDVQIAFEQSETSTKPGNFLSDNWGILTLSLLAFFDVVARLTPTIKDNSIVNLLTTIINAIIPNFKKGGGVF